MKNNIKQYILIIAAFVSVATSFMACGDDELATYGDGGNQVVIDPYVQIKTSVISFQAGTESYQMALSAINGSKDINTINVYSEYTDAASGTTIDPVLFNSFSISDPVKEDIVFDFTYDDLKAGISVNGQSLPTDQLELPVGSAWRLTFEGVRPDGEILPLAGAINVAVLSPYAGLYRVLEASYYRIGVNRADVIADNQVIGDERFIGSVDETTFSHNDYVGPFAITGEQFTFSIDFTDNSITIPLESAYPAGYGDYTTNCQDNAADLSNVPCSSSNILIIDEVEGKHQLKLVYGYYTVGSGPREFYELLEKIVE